MRKRKILLFIFAALCLCFIPTAEAYRFESFNWGDKPDAVVRRIKQKDWRVKKPINPAHGIEAAANLYGASCRIQFFFNSRQELASIRMTWPTTGNGETVRMMTIKLYGAPSKTNEYNKHFEWRGSFKGDEIALDYFEGATVLSFTSGYQ